MTLEQVVARLPGARRAGLGYRAPAPCHGSKSGTLAISEGRDGRILLRCFAGCEFGSIVASLGLAPHDLFATSRVGASRPGTAAQPTRAEIVTALEREEARYRSEPRYIGPSGLVTESLGDGVRLVAVDLNEIRRRVSGQLGILLAPVDRLVSDADYGGRQRDPLWPLLLDRGWRFAWLRSDLKEPCCSIDDFASHGAIGFEMLAEAEAYAVATIREMARGSSNVKCERAA